MKAQGDAPSRCRRSSPSPSRLYFRLSNAGILPIRDGGVYESAATAVSTAPTGSATAVPTTRLRAAAPTTTATRPLRTTTTAGVLPAAESIPTAVWATAVPAAAATAAVCTGAILRAADAATQEKRRRGQGHIDRARLHRGAIRSPRGGKFGGGATRPRGRLSLAATAQASRRFHRISAIP